MRTILLFALSIALSGGAWAQTDGPARESLKGKHELSPSVSFQFIKDKGSDGNLLFSVPFRWGYFVGDRASVGAELLSTFMTDSDPAVIFSGRLEYNAVGKSNAFPFFSAGLGITNGSMPLDRIAAKMYDGALAVITLGTGLKVSLGSVVLFRTDLQYRRFSGKDTYNDFYTDEEITNKIRTGYVDFTFGISLLL